VEEKIFWVEMGSEQGLSIFKYFWVLINQEKAEMTAYGYVRRGLSSAFLLLYTKLKTTATPMESDFDSYATAIGVICRRLIWMSRAVLCYRWQPVVSGCSSA
jgi:hypothetical protein